MPFLSHHYLEEDPFSKVLFYSVLVHYLFFFILFGNPFLIRPSGGDGKGSPQADKPFSVNLLSIPNMKAPPQEVASPNRRPTIRIDEEAFLGVGEIGEGEEAPLPTQSEASNKLKPTFSETGLPPLESMNPVSTDPAVPKKKLVRRMPPSMTGPEDCMLKVVGMVCPGGEIGCIEAYKSFCATLPD